MKYRLGLDLGVGSIGSSVIELDEQNQPKSIKDAGVRIFIVSENAEDRRLKRQIRKNYMRTTERLNLLAQKLFENNLWVNNAALPDTEEGRAKKALMAKSPYKIRYDALEGKLASRNYVGRALLHLAKHRGAGFLSILKESQSETLKKRQSIKAKNAPYTNMVQHLKETNSRTLGEFFYKRIQNSYKPNENGKINPRLRIIRQREGASDTVDYAIPRHLVKDEFHQIWDTQATYFPQMRKEGVKQEIYDILFYERPAVPYAVGKCLYFNEEDRLLKAHPLSEMRRIYEEVNNIRILTNTNRRRLTLAERDTIVNELLLKGKNAGKRAIGKLLNLPEKTISLQDDTNINAYLYSRDEFVNNACFCALSEEDLIKFANFLGNPVNPNNKDGHLYKEDELIALLKQSLKIDEEEEIQKLLDMIPKKRSMLGLTATKAILEKLKADVKTHREITDDLCKDDSHFMAAEEIARQNQGKYTQLPYYGEILRTDTQPLPPLMIKHNLNLNPEEVKWGKIANPGVHMVLNQIRRVVNDIIRIYGKPYDINIEVSRELGLSAEGRQQLQNDQKKNEQLNDKAREYLKEHNLFINRKNILKYKLAEEQAWCDAYNPTREIARDFSGFEIEHIIPQAKGGTDTYNNLCLVNRNDNNNKGNDFAYDYFIRSGKPAEVIRLILDCARTRMPHKAWRFEADAKERYQTGGDPEEVTRYLTDTSYIAKMAMRYLRAIVDCSDSDEVIHNRILAVRGAQTAHLRKCWNLLGLEYDLMGLNIPRYLECSPYWVEQTTGEIIDGTAKPDIDGNWKFFDKQKNKQWKEKPRIDHRHHAMDAITIACMTRSMIQQMSTGKGLEKYTPPLPLTTIKSVGAFRRTVLEVLKNTNVSHKPDHSQAGQLHKETGRIRLCVYPEDLKKPEDQQAWITVQSKKVLEKLKDEDLNKLLVSDSIKDEWHENIARDRARQAQLVQNFKLYRDPARQALIAENERNVSEGKKELPITEYRILCRAFSMIQKAGLWKGPNIKVYEKNTSLIYIPKHGVAYEGGNNHRVDFYLKNGKIGWEVIKRFDINQRGFQPAWKKQNGKIIWSVQQQDLMEVDTPAEWQTYTDKPRCFARVRKFSDDNLAIDYMADARPENDKVLPYNKAAYLTKGLRYFIQHHARKIELTPFGKIKKKHKVLSNGPTKKT